jgi:xylulokinase
MPRMATPVSIGIDLGTSGLKAIALTPDGRGVAEASASYPLLTPHPGWTEQHPADWLEAARAALKALSGELRAKGFEALAIGLSGQMHGAVFLDASGNVVRPAPLWNDQRTGDACQEIERAVPRSELIQRTGNPAVTGFQLPKLVWLRASEPESFARVRHVLLPKDYLGYAMTGNPATEPSDASGIGALNLKSRNWDDDVLGALRLERNLFPTVIPSHGLVGKLSGDWARETDLPAGLPVIAGAGDNAGAAIGLGLSSARMGVGSVSLGTSGVIFVPLERPTPDPEGRIHLFCHADGGYHLLGVTLAAAGSLQWFRDHLAPGVAFDDLMAEAEAVPSGSEGVSFMPYLAGERSPWLDPALRGAWLGLSLAHTRGHMTRAILEGVAFSLRDACDVMRGLAPLTKALAIGGGSRSLLWLSIVGNALGVQFEKPSLEEGPARGAAILGFVGAGVFSSVPDAINATIPASEPIQIERDAALEAAYARFKAGFEAVQHVKATGEHRPRREY